MGRHEMAEKWRNPVTYSGGCRRVRRPDPGRPTAVGLEISRRWSSGGGAPSWLARVARWWPKMSPTAKTHLA